MEMKIMVNESRIINGIRKMVVEVKRNIVLEGHKVLDAKLSIMKEGNLQVIRKLNINNIESMYEEFKRRMDKNINGYVQGELLVQNRFGKVQIINLLKFEIDELEEIPF